MQAFLTNNVVNWNLMSLTGYRTLIILRELMESPKSNDEINECLLNNQYIQEKFSSDTLRIYLNSLRAVGCEITRADKLNSKKYKLISHPFVYDIPKTQLKAIAKLYKSAYEQVDVPRIVAFESFLTTLSCLVENEETRDFLQNMSKLKRIDREILKDLIKYCNNKTRITFLYNSPKSGKKEIEFICDKLAFESEKLYLWGTNLTHREYSYFSVSRILKISSIKLIKEPQELPQIKVIYELSNKNYLPEEDENILEKTDNKLIIEINSKNEFSVMQRILYMGSDCRVLEPKSFKKDLLDKLKIMKESYENI